MLEKDFNHDLVSLFNEHGWSYKIPDPSGMEALHASERPFDGFAHFASGAFYFESKLIKNKLSAFSKNRVEDHQYDALLALKKIGAFTAVTLGYWVPRKDYKLFVFDPEFLFSMSQKSILGKQLKWYDDNGFSISMRQKDLGTFTPNLLKEKLICSLPPTN